MKKKDLMEIIAGQIYEMAMDYDTEHRPDPDIEKKLKTGDTPMSKIPMPKSEDPEKQNFLEFLGSERYKDVVSNVRRYLKDRLKFNLKGRERFNELTALMKETSFKIMAIERSHAKELEQLAIRMVTQEFNIPEGLVRWDVKLTPIHEMNLDNFTKEKGGEINPEAVELEKELFTDLENLNLERAKRRLINAITQGASEKGHYSYHMVEDEIQKITGSSEIVDYYGIMMSVNDAVYWQYDDKELDAKVGREGFNPVGTEEVEDGDPPIIKVRGINFPVLVHECYKGFLDFMAIHGIPKKPSGEYDEELWSKVQEHEDTVNKEVWDIRLGPKIWERIRETIPGDILTDEGLRDIQLYFFKTIYSLPAKEFLTFMKEVIGQTKTGARLMKEYIDGIREMLSNQESEEALSIFNDDLDSVSAETSDDSIRDFLSDLGIDLSGGDEDDDDDDGGVLVPSR